MRLSPLLARADAHSLAHYVWTSGVMAASLVYILVPFVIHHHQALGAQAISAAQETILPPTPDHSRAWTDPDYSFRAQAPATPQQEAPTLEDPLNQDSWTGIPLVGESWPRPLTPSYLLSPRAAP